MIKKAVAEERERGNWFSLAVKSDGSPQIYIITLIFMAYLIKMKLITECITDSFAIHSDKYT